MGSAWIFDGFLIFGLRFRSAKRTTPEPYALKTPGVLNLSKPSFPFLRRKQTDTKAGEPHP